MKKLIILIFMMLFLLTACGEEAGEEARDIKIEDIKIERITVITAEDNPENIWKIEWPARYFSGSEEHILKSGWKEISDEDIDYIISYAENNLDPSSKGNVFLCYVSISVVENGNNHYGYSVPIYDKYPEGFDEFAGRLNAVFGDDRTYICTGENPREMTAEYFSQITGITDDDVNGGTVQELLDHLGIKDLDILNWKYLKNGYIYRIAEDYDLCRLLRYDINSAPSTDEECHEYAQMLFDELGAEGELTKGESRWYDNEWYEFEYGDKTVRIYRSELTTDDIRDWGGWIDSYAQSNKMFENTQPPSSEMQGYDAFDYTYSEDFKFLIAVSESYSREKTVFHEVAGAVERIDNRE